MVALVFSRIALISDGDGSRSTLYIGPPPLSFLPLPRSLSPPSSILSSILSSLPSRHCLRPFSFHPVIRSVVLYSHSFTMLSNTLFTAATAASLLTPFVAAFDAQAKTNVAVYYGQGAYQKRLRHFCQETSMDIINLAFLNVFPDQGLNGYPETNFGNQCGSQTFDINGENTGLLSNCPYLVEDIPFCQAAGKKVLLSLGGAVPDTQDIESEGSAKAFADFLWYSFGPPTDMWAEHGLPRPFNDVVLDGFDFDIEHNDGSGMFSLLPRPSRS